MPALKIAGSHEGMDPGGHLGVWLPQLYLVGGGHEAFLESGWKGDTGRVSTSGSGMWRRVGQVGPCAESWAWNDALHSGGVTP